MNRSFGIFLMWFLAVLGVDLWSVVNWVNSKDQVIFGEYAPGPALYSLITYLTTALLVGMPILIWRRHSRRRLKIARTRVQQLMESCYHLLGWIGSGAPQAESIARFHHDQNILAAYLVGCGIKFETKQVSDSQESMGRLRNVLIQLMEIDRNLSTRLD